MTSSTAEVNAINLQVYAADQAAADQANGTYSANISADPNYYTWLGTQQVIPLGMEGDPEGFAAGLRTALPEVNTLRLSFNAYSFNADGALSDQYARFLDAAAAEGFQIIFVYSDGEVQQLGADGSLSSSQIYDALAGTAQDRMTGAWQQMLDWTATHPAVADAVYGYEVMNEPAAYARGADLADAGTQARAMTDFMGLYTAQVTRIAQMIEARSAAHVLVDGWHYSTTFTEFAGTMLGDSSALDAIRAAVGDALVWSSHFYPGAAGTSSAETGADIAAALAAVYAPLGSDAVLMSETNMLGSAVYDPATTMHYIHAFADAAEWLAAAGIGAAWFPGAETGASNFVVVDPEGGLRFLHQPSYAAGMNLFSMGEDPVDHAGGEAIAATLIAGQLRNEPTELGYDPANPFDAAHYLGTAFGFGGNDTLQGSDLANNFLYGGSGDDTVAGGALDDFLYGQGGNDSLVAGAGHDLLFGGHGDDTLVAGTGANILEGGSGADLFVLAASGNDIVTDFNPGEGDSLDFGGAFTSFDDLLAHARVLPLNGPAADDAIVTRPDGTTVTFLDVGSYFATATNVARGIIGTFDGTDAGERITVGDIDRDGEHFGTDVLALEAAGGNDTVVGGNGNETIDGGAGNDIIGGGHGNDVLLGGAGDDQIHGQHGNNQLFGGAGNDTLTSGRQSSVLFGGAGNDVLRAWIPLHSAHTMVGGTGYDLFSVSTASADASSSASIVDFDPAADRLQVDGAMVDFTRLPGGMTAVETRAGVELTLADSGATIVLSGMTLGALRAAPDGTVTGTDGADLIDASYRDAQGDYIGNPNPFLVPTVDAGAGNDTVIATADSDSILGGAGDDLIRSDRGNDTIDAGAGNDTVTARAGHNLIFGGAGDDNLGGGTGDSTLDGGDGRDRLDVNVGHGGHFVLTGGGGADVFSLTGEDASSAARVEVTDFTVGSDRLQVNGTTLDLSGADPSVTLADGTAGVVVTTAAGASGIVLSGLTAADLAGASVTDGMSIVTGTDGADLIDAHFVDAAGHAVSDWADIVFAGAGNDTIVAGDGADRLYGGAGNDIIAGGMGNALIDGGDGADTLSGDHGANTLFGGAGDDLLSSGRDGSVVNGGAGDDVLTLDISRDGQVATGGDGADVFAVSAPRDDRISHSLITDFVEGQDHLLVAGQELVPSWLPDGFTGQNTADGFELTLGQGSTILLQGLHVDPAAVAPDEPAVTGTLGDDTIDAGYTDAMGLTVTALGDVVRAEAGNDLVKSGYGNDTVYGGAGNDTLYLDHGDDSASGGAGDDAIYGQSGHNVLRGGGGDDLLHSGRHDSTLDGGAGNDHLIADINRSSHVLTGGRGADLFDFTAVGAGRVSHSEVTDFAPGVDSLMIAGQIVDLTTLPDGLTGHGTADGYLLDLGGGSSILFDGLLL